jgi:hypothetical protein
VKLAFLYCSGNQFTDTSAEIKAAVKQALPNCSVVS